jgi:hypothetical protein
MYYKSEPFRTFVINFICLGFSKLNIFRKTIFVVFDDTNIGV